MWYFLIIFYYYVYCLSWISQVIIYVGIIGLIIIILCEKECYLLDINNCVVLVGIS